MKKVINRIPSILFIVTISILGFMIGVLTMSLWQENCFIKDGVLGQEFIYQIKDLNIDKRALFFLCLGKRLRAFFILFLLAFSSVNVAINIIFFFLSGLYIGSVLELFAIRYGIQGILMYLSFALPQGIFYILGFLSIGCWCLNLEKIPVTIGKRKVEKLRSFTDKRRLGFALILILIGILLESYVNSEIFLIFI